jgi:acyl-CoA synthetase (AMP-forming)/AMP-acid ligase II
MVTAGRRLTGSDASETKLNNILARLSSERRGAVALESGDVRWSLDDLLAEADALGSWIETLAPARAAVMLVPNNTPQSVAFIVGAIGRDRVPILADPAWTATELAALMSRCGVATTVWHGRVPQGVVTVTDSFADFEAAGAAKAPRLCGNHRIAFGRFTSGTTGTARCLGFSQDALVAAARSWSAAAGYGPRDRVLCLATLNNGLAFNAALFPVLLSGARLVFHGGRLIPRSLARTFRASEPTVLVAFPFIYGQLTGTNVADVDLARLRLAISSAARLETDIKAAWLEKSTALLCDYYGLVEVGPCTFNDGNDATSVGRALPGVSIAVTDEEGRYVEPGRSGRIRVRTESMAEDFLDDDHPRLTADIDSRGRYVTRDLGHLDSAGRLYLTGRVGRQINIEGRKIEPTEVESVLTAISGVHDAVVVAEVGDKRPELAAYIEATGVSREEILARCVEELAPYKVPQRIEIVRHLPRSSTGKISIGRLTNARQTLA